MEKGDEVLTRIASEILAAARAKGATIEDWYLGDEDYEKYQEIAQQRDEPDMRICGAKIHRAAAGNETSPDLASGAFLFAVASDGFPSLRMLALAGCQTMKPPPAHWASLSTSSAAG